MAEPQSMFAPTTRCPHCIGTQSTKLYSYAEDTKWDTIKHGIEGECVTCKEVFVLTEDET